jgi:hypothetical protein
LNLLRTVAADMVEVDTAAGFTEVDSTAAQGAFMVAFMAASQARGFMVALSV